MGPDPGGGRSAVIKGVPRLTGAVVEARTPGQELVLGGLAAENTTVIEGVHHLDLGYDNHRLDSRC